MSPWVKLPFSLLVCVLIHVYWRNYGPGNFLWFSDIALFMAAGAMWLRSRWLAGMAAVSVLLLDSVWNLDFFSRLIFGVRIFGLSDYMFNATFSLALRALSLFHVVMPPLLLWLLYKLGYESRAWIAQSILAWIVLPLSWLLTAPAANVNWVRGFGGHEQTSMPPLAYLGLLMLLFPLLVYLPTHLILRRFFCDTGVRKPPQSQREHQPGGQQQI